MAGWDDPAGRIRELETEVHELRERLASGGTSDIAAVLEEHEGCRANDSRDGHHTGSGDTGFDVWSCGIRVPFVDDLEIMERLHLAAALAPLVAVQ